MFKWIIVGSKCSCQRNWLSRGIKKLTSYLTHFKMVKIPTYLITGGLGFIGSNLATHLLNQGLKVRILDNLSSGKKENAPSQAEVIIGDITDQGVLKMALEGVSGCFHLAAEASVAKSIEKWAPCHLVNQYGTVLIIETLLELKQKIPLVFASSAAVYGNPKKLPLKEEDSLLPLSPYGIDKKGCEEHLRMAYHLFQLPSVSFRFFNVYGPKQDPLSPYSGVISHFTKQLKEKGKVTIFGSGEFVRDFIFVGDIVRFLHAAMESKIDGAHVFNLCTGKGTTISGLAEMLGEVMGIECQKEFLAERKGDVSASVGDPSAAERFFKMRAETSLREGLFEYINAEVKK